MSPSCVPSFCHYLFGLLAFLLLIFILIPPTSSSDIWFCGYFTLLIMLPCCLLFRRCSIHAMSLLCSTLHLLYLPKEIHFDCISSFFSVLAQFDEVYLTAIRDPLEIHLFFLAQAAIFLFWQLFWAFPLRSSLATSVFFRWYHRNLSYYFGNKLMALHTLSLSGKLYRLGLAFEFVLWLLFECLHVIHFEYSNS